jgi:hypothetical protein
MVTDNRSFTVHSFVVHVSMSYKRTDFKLELSIFDFAVQFGHNFQNCKKMFL